MGIFCIYCACAKRPYFHSRSKIWHHHRVPRPRFSIGLKCGNFGDSAINKGYIAYFLMRMRETAMFPLPIWGHFLLKSKHSAIFLLPVYLAYCPRKHTTCWATNVDHFHHVWSWYDYPSPSYSVVSADTLRDLVTLTFDLLTLNSGQTWQVTCSTPPPSSKIRSWFMSSDVRHRPPLTMLLEPLRMRRITWPVRRGQIFVLKANAMSAHAPNYVTCK